MKPEAIEKARIARETLGLNKKEKLKAKIKEIKEEANLEVGKLNYLLDVAFIRPDGIPVVVLSQYCDYESGEVELDKDSVEYVWATCEEAKKYDLIEGILEEIQMVDKIKKGEDPNDVDLRRINLNK